MENNESMTCCADQWSKIFQDGLTIDRHIQNSILLYCVCILNTCNSLLCAIKVQLRLSIVHVCKYRYLSGTCVCVFEIKSKDSDRCGVVSIVTPPPSTHTYLSSSFPFVFSLSFMSLLHLPNMDHQPFVLLRYKTSNHFKTKQENTWMNHHECIDNHRF